MLDVIGATVETLLETMPDGRYPDTNRVSVMVNQLMSPQPVDEEGLEDIMNLINQATMADTAREVKAETLSLELL